MFYHSSKLQYEVRDLQGDPRYKLIRAARPRRPGRGSKRRDR